MDYLGELEFDAPFPITLEAGDSSVEGSRRFVIRKKEGFLLPGLSGFSLLPGLAYLRFQAVEYLELLQIVRKFCGDGLKKINTKSSPFICKLGSEEISEERLLEFKGLFEEICESRSILQQFIFDGRGGWIPQAALDLAVSCSNLSVLQPSLGTGAEELDFPRDAPTSHLKQLLLHLKGGATLNLGSSLIKWVGTNLSDFIFCTDTPSEEALPNARFSICDETSQFSLKQNLAPDPQLAQTRLCSSSGSPDV